MKRSSSPDLDDSVKVNAIAKLIAGKNAQQKKTQMLDAAAAPVPVPTKRKSSNRNNSATAGTSTRQAYPVRNSTALGYAFANVENSNGSCGSSDNASASLGRFERLERSIISSRTWQTDAGTLETSSQEAEALGSFPNFEAYQGAMEELLTEEAREGARSSFGESCESGRAFGVDVPSVQAMPAAEGWFSISIAGHQMFPGEATRDGALLVLLDKRPPRMRDAAEWVARQLRESAGRMRASASPPEGGGGPGARAWRGRSRGRHHRRPPPAPEPEPHDLAACLVVVRQGDRRQTELRAHAFPGELGAGWVDPMKAMDAVGRNWWAVPAGDLTTVRRETDALLNMKGSSLSQVILDPRIMAERRAKQTAEQQWPHEVAQQGYNEALKRKYDFSQLKAIEESCAHLSHPCFGGGGREDAPWLPFTLIQGPPGTGKTHTVRGILNTWHLVQYQRYYTSLVACLAPKSKIAAEWRQSRGRNSSLNSGVQDIYSGQLSSAEVDDRLLLLPGVEPQPRILVCAPSNAATDELLQRIMNIGFRAGNGSMYWPNVVRVGSEAAPLSQRARDVWVDNIVNQYLSATDISAVISKRDERLREAQRHLGALCHHGQLALQPGADTDRLATEAAQIYDAWYKARQEVVKLNLVISYMQTQHRRHRNELELELVKNAEIIFTTLSSSGRQIFSRLSERKCVKFETVLIDEACQASEVSVLQPLMYGCRKCVLVGDPQQLPATVLSLKAKEHQMERSLFERLQHASCPVHMLMVQYRMHPEIRHFPSDHFYEGKLQDGDCILQRPDPPFYSHSLLKPYIFFDVDQGRELRMGGRSLSNQAEADLAAALYVALQKTLKELEWSEPVSVGVITPYREQRNCLKKTFKAVCGEAKAGEVFIETVDSFQGRQLDVVMLSCVRASSSRSGIGFVGDIRRLNVAITRAQLALWVLGDAATLGLSPTWRALIEDAERRRRIIPNASARSLFPEQFRPSDPRPQPGQQPLEPAPPPAVWPSDPRQSAGAMPNPMGQAQRAQSVSQPNAEADPHSRAMAAWSEGA